MARSDMGLWAGNFLNSIAHCIQSNTFMFLHHWNIWMCMNIWNCVSCAIQDLVNWCKPSPCKNGGTCRQSGITYTCQCQTGWTGLYCDVPSVSCEVAAKQRGRDLVWVCVCSSFCKWILCLYSLLHLDIFDSLHFSLSALKVWMLPDCAVTLATVWMLETHTTASARQDTLAATVRSRWMSAYPTLARMELHALIT